MSPRRLLVLAVLVLAAGALMMLVDAPIRRSGEETVSGPRLVRMAPASVDRVVVTIGSHRAAADRVAGQWRVGDRPASAAFGEALDDFLRTLTALRAVDRFRPNDGASFGFAPSPRAIIELGAPREGVRIVLGELNGARSAVYAQRDGDSHVWLVGLYLVAAMERVIYFADVDAASPRVPSGSATWQGGAPASRSVAEERSRLARSRLSWWLQVRSTPSPAPGTYELEVTLRQMDGPRFDGPGNQPLLSTVTVLKP